LIKKYSEKHNIVKEQYYFETEILCGIINAFNVTFDQFNASLLNKKIFF